MFGCRMLNLGYDSPMSLEMFKSSDPFFKRLRLYAYGQCT